MVTNRVESLSFAASIFSSNFVFSVETVILVDAAGLLVSVVIPLITYSSVVFLTKIWKSAHSTSCCEAI
jgi:hypothetical protein